jgi:hypothetical protein
MNAEMSFAKTTDFPSRAAPVSPTLHPDAPNPGRLPTLSTPLGTGAGSYSEAPQPLGARGRLLTAMLPAEF